ncbi:hypothetical protein EJ05DRAFT_537209 [Pseudovirgaria hyperparasitica]|uniref:PCI domain-containing protein n=1 Tax=Pseudovirgaria hyperparasitica TaxID=470096 RepID=A0A6A6WDW5_9PEZI|nr:uncharacterized protein EJ05DRAFT_537209 [Pseudovirgaria hyperparasitica]KAF2760036.1 hypothetical protein EJ05DRAFT_537209 [Pseudovirgaria hyperparasitica]
MPTNKRGYVYNHGPGKATDWSESYAENCLARTGGAAGPRGPSSKTSKSRRSDAQRRDHELRSTIKNAKRRLKSQLHIPSTGLSAEQFIATVKPTVYDLDKPRPLVPEQYRDTWFNTFWNNQAPQGHIKRSGVYKLAAYFCEFVYKELEKHCKCGEIRSTSVGNFAVDWAGNIELPDSEYSDCASDYSYSSVLRLETPEIDLPDVEPEVSAAASNCFGVIGGNQAFPNICSTLPDSWWSFPPDESNPWIGDQTQNTSALANPFSSGAGPWRSSTSSFGLPAMDSGPKVTEFLKGVNNLIAARDGAQLQAWLLIEPPFANDYNQMIAELRQAYPRTEPPDGQWSTLDPKLEMRCAALLPIASQGVDDVTWGAFTKFMAQYLAYIRDVDGNDIKGAYDLLSELVGRTNGALSSPAFGEIILPTAVGYCKTLTSFSILLDKRNDIPRMIAEDGTSESLPERAANTVRVIFTTCLNDRTPVKGGRPEGKKAAIYTIANTCLKVLFAAKKVGATEQIFNNIQNASPPLSLYPAAERVTYLYYLGRFHFSTGHFYRASLALQSAFDQTPSYYPRQRRAILIHLITSNITLGRFPTHACYALPEARGLHSKFSPLIDTIRKGHLERFRRLTSLSLLNDPTLHPSPPAQWLYRHALLLPLRRTALVLVHRTLLRKIFILFGDPGDPTAQKPPNLDLAITARLFAWLEVRALRPQSQVPQEPAGVRNLNHIFGPTTALHGPEDFAAIPWSKNRFVHADLHDESPTTTTTTTTTSNNNNKPNNTTLLPHNRPPLPDVPEIEALAASLMQQGLLNGYMSHRGKKLALSGARREGGALKNGFPPVYAALVARCDADVPGWKRDEAVVANGGRGAGGGAQRFGPGMVVNLSGARPVGF